MEFGSPASGNMCVGGPHEHDTNRAQKGLLRQSFIRLYIVLCNMYNRLLTLRSKRNCFCRGVPSSLNSTLNQTSNQRLR